MESLPTEAIDSLAHANELISRIARCATETEVQEAALAIIRSFGMQVFVFAVRVRSGSREHCRYLVGCDPRVSYRYLQQKWHAIDPLIIYALHNTSPVLASDLPAATAGQVRMRLEAAESGFRGGIAVPAHGGSPGLVGVLYLGTDQGSRQARQSLAAHRHLMRVLAMELLEWWRIHQRETSRAELGLDPLDIELLCQARDHATAKEAAAELGLILSCVDSRYERLIRKLEASCKRIAVEKAIALGLISPGS